MKLGRMRVFFGALTHRCARFGEDSEWYFEIRAASNDDVGIDRRFAAKKFRFSACLLSDTATLYARACFTARDILSRCTVVIRQISLFLRNYIARFGETYGNFVSRPNEHRNDIEKDRLVILGNVYTSWKRKTRIRVKRRACVPRKKSTASKQYDVINYCNKRLYITYVRDWSRCQPTCPIIGGNYDILYFSSA